MANILNVTLNMQQTPPRLEVDDKSGQNKVDPGPNPKPIKWILTGNLAQGSFCPMSATPPAFEWKQTPPDGLFTDAVVGGHGNNVSLDDKHVGPTTEGDWIYALAVTLDGVIYTTTCVLPSRPLDNPNIINR